MGLLGKLIKTAVVAGGAIAAVKVSEKYTENNPEGVKDPQARADAIKQAANEVYNSAVAAANEKAPGIVNAVNDIKEGKVPDVAKMAADKAKEKAPDLLNKVENMAKEKAPDLTAKVQNAANIVAGKVQQFADTLDSEVVDADIVEFEDKKDE